MSQGSLIGSFKVMNFRYYAQHFNRPMGLCLKKVKGCTMIFSGTSSFQFLTKAVWVFDVVIDSRYVDCP